MRNSEIIRLRLIELGFNWEFDLCCRPHEGDMGEKFQWMATVHINPDSLGLFGILIFKMTVKVRVRDIQPSDERGWGCILLEYRWEYKTGSSNGADIVHYYNGEKWVIDGSRAYKKEARK